jgi:hypothetical protein
MSISFGTHKFGIPTFEMASTADVFTNILSPSRAWKLKLGQ